MWDDIIIGKGEHCSNATIHRNGESPKFDISVSRNAYWITDLIFGLGMTVYYDTPEGKKIKKLCDTKATDFKIREYLDMLVIKHLKYKDLLYHIQKECNKAFENGKNAKANEMLNVLGLHQIWNEME